MDSVEKKAGDTAVALVVTHIITASVSLEQAQVETSAVSLPLFYKKLKEPRGKNSLRRITLKRLAILQKTLLLRHSLLIYLKINGSSLVFLTFFLVILHLP